MKEIFIVACIFIGVVVIALAAFIIYIILRSLYEYPHYTIAFDVSGKRSPNINDLIDDYLNAHGLSEFSEHFTSVEEWKSSCKEQIMKSKLKNCARARLKKLLMMRICFISSLFGSKPGINK